jgi:hypothetical protein
MTKRYQTVLIVSAAQIISVEQSQRLLVLRDEGEEDTYPVVVGREFFAKGTPVAGDYFMEYSNGAKSFLEKDVFEKGEYKLLPDETEGEGNGASVPENSTEGKEPESSKEPEDKTKATGEAKQDGKAPESDSKADTKPADAKSATGTKPSK